MPTNKQQRPSSKSAQPARPSKGKPAKAAPAKSSKPAPKKAPLKIVKFAPPPKKAAPAKSAAVKSPAKPASAPKAAAKPSSSAKGVAAPAKSAPAAKAAPAKAAPMKSVAPAKPAVLVKAVPAKPVAGKAAPIVSARSAALAKAAKSAQLPAPVAAPPANLANTSSYLVVLSAHERRGRRFVQLKSPSVLAWFQRGCRLAREGKGWAGDLGGEVRGLDVLFDAVENRRLPVPNTEAELQALLTKYLRAERDLEIEPHFVHVETDDDETEIEYFFFDDAFLESGEALDRLPSPKRRARPVSDEDETEEEETFEADEDDDPYTQLIEKIADA